MMMGSFLFKQKARAMLKGRWQNALVISFFCGVFLTIAQVLQSVTLKDVQSVMDSLTMLMGSIGAEVTNAQTQQVAELYSKLFSELGSIPQNSWNLLIGLNLLALVVTPALTLSCQFYFIRLTHGEDIGIQSGLLSRIRILPKALWLNLRIFAQVFLWSLLLFIPGVIAALRYSMATYFMAEDPSISAGEAIRRSKEAMKVKGRKMSYLMLLISFVGWNLLISFAQILLSGMFGTVITLVAAQFMTLALNTYINASCAAYYFSISDENGMGDLFENMRRRMKQAGISDSDIRAAGFGGKDDVMIEEDDQKNADGGDQE